MQAAVRAFSKADEAIVMLSFAYPGKNLFDSTGVLQCRESNHQQSLSTGLLKKWS
jgi:hypothetical protein